MMRCAFYKRAPTPAETSTWVCFFRIAMAAIAELTYKNPLSTCEPHHITQQNTEKSTNLSRWSLPAQRDDTSLAPLRPELGLFRKKTNFAPPPSPKSVATPHPPAAQSTTPAEGWAT